MPGTAHTTRADFLAVMSHEMRTPLNGIIGLADLLLEAPAAGALGKTERHYVEVIRQSGEHLLQMVNDILDFSRLDAGQLTLEETAFDLRAVIRSAIELLPGRRPAPRASRWSSPWRRRSRCAPAATPRACARCCSTSSATR